MSTRKQREKIVLGTMTLEPESIPEIRERLDASDFSSTGRQQYFETIIESYEDHGTTDVVDVAERAMNKNIIDQHLDPVAPVEFEDAAISGAEALSIHVPELKRASTGEKLHQELTVLQTDRGEDPAENIEQLEDVVDDARKSLSHTSDIVTVSDQKDEIMEQIREAKNGDISGFTTGIRALDEKVGGLEPGDYMIIAARPGMGKSSMARNFSTTAARNDKKTLFVSCEMTAKQLIKQFYCSWCDVEPWKASEGNLSDKEMKRIRSYEGNEQEMIDIITPESNNITEIISMVEGNHQREGYDMVIFDHLQLLSADVQGNRTQELTKVSRRLALLRNRLEVCLIAISQLNRKVEDRNPPKPKLSDLRETGALEQDANKVMMIYRDEYYKGSDEANEGVAEINICKHRGGPTGKVEIAWDGKMMRFGDFHPEPQSFGN